MTTEEFNKKLDAQLKQIEDAKFLFLPVSETHARQVKRIYDKGLNSDNEKIGTYNDSKPIYIDPKDSPKGFPTIGKTGKTGKAGKTGYFDSYKAFRQAIGRETGFVNLRLTENEKFDFTNSISLSGSFYITGFKRPENSKKAERHIKQYGIETFKLSEDEKKVFRESVRKKLYDTLSN